MALKEYHNIKDLPINELKEYSDDIANFLAQETRFDIDTIVKNINVLETTLALHYVFDLSYDRVLFDGGNQVLVHKILTGRIDELLLRTNAPVNLSNDNPYDAYTGGGIGESLGAALSYTDKRNGRTIVVIDDHALNYGVTYEGLVDISRHNPDLTIILIDEQQSLLRHHTSLDVLVKSIRISKTYSTLKKDVRNILDSNPISRPIYKSLVRMRNAVKESVLEPTIFTQFGIDYQGPIDGQSLPDLIRVLELSKTLKGPHVIHVQTRLRSNARRNLDFPKFKTDDATPKNYTSYHEVFDRVLTGMRDPKLLVLVDAISFGDYFKEFESNYPNNYIVSTGATGSLIAAASSYIKQGYRVVLALSSTRILDAISALEHQFVLNDLPLTLLVRHAGLSSHSNRFDHGIFDIKALNAISNIYNPSNLSDAEKTLQTVVSLDGINVVRYQNNSEMYKPSHSYRGESWSVIQEFSSASKAIIITTGASTEVFLSRIKSNDLDVGLIHARLMNDIDQEVLDSVIESGCPVYIYNIESDTDTMTPMIIKHLYTKQKYIPIKSFNLEGISYEDGSRILKRKNELQVDDVFNKILEG